jgi:hypothetical protein
MSPKGTCRVFQQDLEVADLLMRWCHKFDDVDIPGEVRDGAWELGGSR